MSKTIEIPDDWEPDAEPEPMVSYGPREDGRDPSKLIGYDENGRPLYIWWWPK